MTDALAAAAKLKDQGNLEFRAKKYDEAISLYSSAITTIAPAIDPILYSNRAACFIALEKYQEALEDCKIAIGENPNHIKSLDRSYFCYTKLGKPREALVERLAAKVVSGDAEQVYRRIQEGASTALDPIVGKLADQFLKAETKKLADDESRLVFPDAFEMFWHFNYMHSPRHEFTQSDGDATVGTIEGELLEVYKKLREHTYEAYVDAYHLVDKLIEKHQTGDNDNEELKRAYEVRGSFNYLLKREQQAMADFKRSDNSSSVLLKLATTTSNSSEKLSYIEQAKAANKDDPRIDFFQGLMRYEAGEYEPAISSFKKARDVSKAVADDATELISSLYLTYAYWKSKKHVLARSELGALQKSRPGHPRVGALTATIEGDGASNAEKIRLWEKVWEDVETLTKANGYVSDTTPLMNIALIMLETFMDEVGSGTRTVKEDNSDWEPILKVYRDACEADPHSLQCRFGYAQMLSIVYTDAQFENIEENYRKALDLAAGGPAITKVLKDLLAHEVKVALYERYPESLRPLINMVIISQGIRTEF